MKIIENVLQSANAWNFETIIIFIEHGKVRFRQWVGIIGISFSKKNNILCSVLQVSHSPQNLLMKQKRLYVLFIWLQIF